MTIQRLCRFLVFVPGQRTACRSITFLMLLALLVMGLPALSDAQQSCQPDGDVDRNGSVTAADALLAFQQALGLAQLTSCQRTIANVFPQPNAPDANITASDALCIFQKALSLPSCLDTLIVEVERFVSIDTGDVHTCGMRNTGQVECWGDDRFGQSTPSAGTFASISTGGFHTCGMRNTGQVECWGDDNFGQSTPPAGTFASVGTGRLHTCGMRNTGQVECWGDDGFGQSTPPAGTFASISTGGFHTCGMRNTGQVECWGDDNFGQSTPPAGTFASVGTGRFHTCGMRNTGQVECWGDDGFGQSTPPAGTFASVDTGDFHTCGTRNTDRVECWGDDNFGQSTPPAGTFASVSTGGFHTCGIRDTGQVECWGHGDFGQSTPPADPTPSPPTASAGPDQTVDEATLVTLPGSGSDPDGTIARYSWTQISGTPVALSGANTRTASFTAPDVDSDEDLVFQLTVTDDGGASDTDAVTVTVRAAPASSGLREMVFQNPSPGRPTYVIAGDNAGLQYWMDASGAVQQSLYESADGTQRVRTFYDETTGRPRTVLNEASGHWLSIREAGPNRVDFWAYDNTGSYLGGFAIYEKSGQYYTGEIVGIPAHEWNQITGQLHPPDGSWTGSFTLTGETEDGLINIQEVSPEMAELIDGLSTSGPIVAQADFDRQANGRPSSLHNSLTKAGLGLLALGGAVALIPGGQPAAAALILIGGAVAVTAQVLPAISEGIRQQHGRDCPPEGSIFGETCADLTNLAADHLSRQGTGPIEFVRNAMDWIKEAPSRLRGNVANGLQKLKEAATGLFQRDNVGLMDQNERTSLVGPPKTGCNLRGTGIGPDGTSTQLTGTCTSSGDFNVSGLHAQGLWAIEAHFDSTGDVTGGTCQLGMSSCTVSGRIRPPVLTRAIPEQTLTEGEAFTLDLSSYFSHPDGRDLHYHVTCRTFTATTTPDISVRQTGQLTLLPDTVGASTCTAQATVFYGQGFSRSEFSTFLVKVAPATQPDDFDTVPLDDFSVTIPSSCAQQVQICVRDHQCEDGDAIRVTVNGNVEFSGELFNEPSCFDVPVQEGENSVEMLALNGTGYKGDCLHTNENTGEIQINAGTKQSWSHRDGAGSTANLNVTIGHPGACPPTSGQPVQNQAPVARGSIPDQNLTVGETETVFVSSYFHDPDGDALNYSAVPSPNASGIVTVSVSGSRVTFHAIGAGNAIVYLFAIDPGGLFVSQEVTVRVEEEHDLNEIPLDDFDITIPSSCAQQVQICVRDYACEDGDEVAVRVNGSLVFSGELFNTAECFDASVREGENSVRLLALNGSGFKCGNMCDPDCEPGANSHYWLTEPNRDVNTGEVQINGGASQQWRHRGGAGSTANLNVAIGPPGSCPDPDSNPTDEASCLKNASGNYIRLVPCSNPEFPDGMYNASSCTTDPQNFPNTPQCPTWKDNRYFCNTTEDHIEGFSIHFGYFPATCPQ